jgi:NDP-sugar pyrophosphorylase family protein
MKAKCCLIAVGGCGYRLRKDGIAFPYSKSSLEVSGKPMLYWLLDVLKEAGIRRVVMTSERKDYLDFFRRVINDNFSNRFDEVSYNLDFGFGSSGLPFQSKDLLDYPCFFEAGHSFQKSEHYRKMDEGYEQGYLVASGFSSKGYAPRYTIRKEKEKIIYVGKKLASSGEIEVGSPKLFGEDFVNILPKLDYDFNKIFPHYIKDNKLKVIPSDMPLETDVKMEWEEAVPLYKKFILERGLK